TSSSWTRTAQVKWTSTSSFGGTPPGASVRACSCRIPSARFASSRRPMAWMSTSLTRRTTP
ncbi:hypothetical protein AK812_SmicGene47645, partial [Symbiodinium microadriaticum]